MTTSQAHDATPLPAGTCHLRISPEATVQLTEAGRFSLPLELYEGGEKRTAVPLIMTAESVEALYAQIGQHLAPGQNGGAE